MFAVKTPSVLSKLTDVLVFKKETVFSCLVHGKESLLWTNKTKLLESRFEPVK